MKARESGMPEEVYWNSFFDTEMAINILLGPEILEGDWVEFGCGYGTFTLAIAKHIRGVVTALDIEPDLTSALHQKMTEQGLSNIVAVLRDFVANGTGLESLSQSGVLIYNLLHLEQPEVLLNEAYRVLKPGGYLSVMHWRSDIPTPRGPSLDIRPRPDQCQAWMEEAGFQQIQTVDLTSCCPYHFGLVAKR
jgi:ubiquinone/menaquinone biosynthesis C-methylase UbiE